MDENKFVPAYRIWEMIDLFNKCKCLRCQAEKRKWEAKIDDYKRI